MTTTPWLLVPGPVDWAALACQKRWLLRHAETSEEAAGLVHLLDALQDAAVDRTGVPDAVVFPTLDQGEADHGNFPCDHGQ